MCSVYCKLIGKFSLRSPHEECISFLQMHASFTNVIIQVQIGRKKGRIMQRMHALADKKIKIKATSCLNFYKMVGR